MTREHHAANLERPNDDALASDRSPIADNQASLGRRITASLALLVMIAGLLSAGVLVLHVRVTAALEETHADGLAAQEALGLTLAVREHYLHETHTVIQGDRGQVAHHHDWIDDIERRVDQLLPRVPSSERSTLDELRETSQAIDELYRSRLLPAALAGDRETVRQHQRESELLLRGATEAADAIVDALDRRAEQTRREALELSRLAIVVGVAGVLLLGVAALVIAVRLRRAVLAPLARLSAAARRFGAGEFDFRVGTQGLDTSELSALGGALDHMAVELEAREQELLRTERIAAIGQLTAGIAHEINNPIGVIRGYLKTMIPAVPTLGPDDQQELLEELKILDEEAAACQRIVEDLLGFAREPALEWQRVQISELVDDAVRRFTSTLAHDPPPQIEIDVDAATLELDPVRMHQVLANLLRNAVDASPSSGAKLQLRGRVHPNHYTLEVTDNGPGIAADKRERVFEPFFSERRSGSGLGLAVSRGIVEAHGGRIYAAQPSAGQGARITLEIMK
ncbi:periplasmic sensor signal transduction histidine kinase [Enhygromyxa salina]|uniref:histidine kinase n=1 Tax=Enhygromyxa salina TaxID=215803 RepID=A0A0C1ZFZ8_9BACT|nr:ATP-binding protein [Enhygromyxa salina]KIG16564.1 periplasmic sensor signal transduction histidine kinase [Enhygromyxa salina]